MAAQKGRDILLKISDGADPPGFVSVAGLRTRTFSLRAASVESTDSDSPESWRELMAGAGVKSCAVSGGGVFRDAESDARVRAAFFTQSTDEWLLVIPDFGALTGRFIVTGLDYLGEHDGEARFSISLASAGALSFEAA
jgi:TP901-1 family phage major tail protein